ncbi:conserved membrane hypothetical protein [Nitrosomonas nitrosa]|uniref:Uncharacterized protein n=1 Tax=Nitrosomonas nitrosa TaxID=52442 RepID=A0A8H9DBG3_9PROT|nr:hypothetical protein [Nitrosomonas nitrosa]CAE6518766.1 conserved membrane hypothetical protein [Nitrosomonas nitrosa]
MTKRGKQAIREADARKYGFLAVPLSKTRSIQAAHEPRKPDARFLAYLGKAVIWGTLTFYITKEFASHHFWLVVLSVLLFSIPIVICGIYGNTIRQIWRLTIFRKQGWLFKWLSSRFFKSIFWALWALGTSFFMLIQFHGYNDLEWMAFFLVIPVFWLAYKFFRYFIAQEIAPYLVTEMALTSARRLCPLLMLIIHFVFMAQLVKWPEYLFIHEAISAQKIKFEGLVSSALVSETSQFLAIYNGIKAYLLGQIGTQNSFWGWLLIGAIEFMIYYNACAILSCFLIPPTEFRRLFQPASHTDTPPPLSPSRIATTTTLFTFVTVFIYLYTFKAMEEWVRHTPAIADSRQNAEVLVVQKVEQIGDVFYKKGTIAQLTEARFNALRHVEHSRTKLENQIDSAFDRLEMNVDHYLDWYYSLVGEYTRIGKLLIGELEAFMIEKLEQSLMYGDPFQDFQALLDDLVSTHQAAAHTYQETAQRIMQANRLDPSDNPIQVIQQTTLQDVINPIVPHDVISLPYRLGGGTVAGAVTAAVTGKIIGKLAGKNILKLAASALFKITAGKVAGAAASVGAGAVTGAAIGSVAPGAGTVIGAAVGGIIGGLGAGIAVDKMLIELEEKISREQFRNEILTVIQEVRTEIKAQIVIDHASSAD